MRDVRKRPLPKETTTVDLPRPGTVRHSSPPHRVQHLESRRRRLWAQPFRLAGGTETWDRQDHWRSSVWQSARPRESIRRCRTHLQRSFSA